MTEDAFLMLSEKGSFQVPNALLPGELHNEGNYIISLSELTRWLAAQAEDLGVEIYPGFAADEVLYDSDGRVSGVATKDVGIAKNGELKDTFERGIALRARQTFFAEGCRGSCSEEVIKKFDLRKGEIPGLGVSRDEQTYGLGVKEVWKVPEGKFKSGFVQHTLGWPLQSSVTSDVYGKPWL